MTPGRVAISRLISGGAAASCPVNATSRPRLGSEDNQIGIVFPTPPRHASKPSACYEMVIAAGRASGLLAVRQLRPTNFRLLGKEQNLRGTRISKPCCGHRSFTGAARSGSGRRPTCRGNRWGGGLGKPHGFQAHANSEGAITEYASGPKHALRASKDVMGVLASV
jgi:hypothetical protein